jgi:hypothetical protein
MSGILAAVQQLERQEIRLPDGRRLLYYPFREPEPPAEPAAPGAQPPAPPTPPGPQER